MDSSFLGKDGFIWWKGVVEDRKDPIMLGRVRVRIFGWHSEDRQQIPTEELPWAMPSVSFDTGRNPVGLKEGDWVWGFFMDGPEAQRPVVVGVIPGIDEKPAAPEIGFGDPTQPGEVNPDTHPRPPDLNAAELEEKTEDKSKKEEDTGAGGRFSNPDKLPGGNVAFGELIKYYDPENYKFDINKDGSYDASDSSLIVKAATNILGQSIFGGGAQLLGVAANVISKFLDASGNIKISPEELTPPTVSPYPLQDRLMEPTTSRLARNEMVDQTIVGLKRGQLATGTAAGFEDGGVGLQATVAPQPFDEPETPYDAKYPFNHVYESESGHIVEIDDSPGAERLHWYHRSGTFREIHPDGTQVTKVKKNDYNFVIKDFYGAAGGSMNFHATEALRMKADQALTLNAGSSLNTQVGEDINTVADGDANTRIKGGTYTVIDEDMWKHVLGDAMFCVKEGELHIKAKKKIVIDSDATIELKSKQHIKLSSPITTMQGAGGGLTTVNMVSVDIKSLFLMAHTSMVSNILVPGDPLEFLPPIAFPRGIETNRAGDDAWYKESPEDASKKFGFLLPNFSAGAVWKPVSESDKKLVTLAPKGNAAPHKFYEAIPTGELEAVRIAYQHEDGTQTFWDTVRPVHERGKEITNMFGAPRRDTYLDGRIMYRWPKPGKDFPKQLIWEIGGVEDLILDSAIRHQNLDGAFDAEDAQLDFDVTTAGPEAGSEEDGTASPKFGYLLPSGKNGDVWKPIAESDGNLCTLSASGGQHELYAAIDTGEKEVINVKYLNISGTVTSWTITRPVFKMGALIDKPRLNTMFLDGARHLCRWNKPGAAYPKNIFWVVKDGSGVTKIVSFIADPASRHQCSPPFPNGFDEKLIKPDASTNTQTASSSTTPSEITDEERANARANKNNKRNSVRPKDSGTATGRKPGTSRVA
jgi:hypothetical protein